MSGTEPFRGVLVWDNDTNTFREKRKERKVETHFVISDEIPETESMATQDREYFTSRSKYYRHLKEHGYHVKEAGEDSTKPVPKDHEAYVRELKDAAEKAYHDIKNDRIPFTEEEKARWREEERLYQAWKKRNQL